jgi:hypothetical protein
MADGRVSQLVAETLSLPTPAARTTQLIAETLTSTSLSALAEARLTHLIAETLSEYHSPPPPAQVTQLLAETLTAVPPSPIRVSQAPLELLDQYQSPARVSQAPVENVQQWTAPLVYARLSQAPLEIIYPFGCYVPPSPPCITADFVVDTVDPGGSCETPPPEETFDWEWD